MLDRVCSLAIIVTPPLHRRTDLIWTLISWPLCSPSTLPRLRPPFLLTSILNNWYKSRRSHLQPSKNPNFSHCDISTPPIGDRMDDHHDQPIWPMIQGAANYAFNIIEEVWGMIWRPVYKPQEQTGSETPSPSRENQGEMQEVGHDDIAKKLANPLAVTAEHRVVGA